MGYSHYWSYSTIISNDIRIKIINEVKLFIKMNKNIKLQETDEKHTCFSSSKPFITTNEIIFNGVDGYETFIVDFNKINENSFCKTNNKPYDLIVCLTLLSMANHIENFTFTTDGKFVEWKPIFEKYIKYVGNIRINLDNHIFNDETNFANIM